jgi:hypothetical protein
MILIIIYFSRKTEREWTISGYLCVDGRIILNLFCCVKVFSKLRIEYNGGFSKHFSGVSVFMKSGNFLNN